jgi:Tfp pilus assembly protein PilF
MTSAKISSLTALKDGPRDGALLRVSLANAYLSEEQLALAASELRAALRFDPDYSLAWKLLGATLAQSRQNAEAIHAYRNGIAAAIKRGDKQAEKEMGVFLRRLEKLAVAPAS